MEHLVFEGHDPAANLAMEEALFRTFSGQHPGLFILWQNRPAVIIGRYQILENEVNTDYAKKNNIDIVRRITGGGAVYHDAGNLNFSFIDDFSDNLKFEFAPYLNKIIAALAKIGINAKLTGRNDLEIADRKISGSSMIRHRNKILLHGTLLIDTDIKNLENLLYLNTEKIKKHGVSSIRSRIGTLKSLISTAIDVEHIKQALLTHCAPTQAIINTKIKKIANNIKILKYENRHWNYNNLTAYANSKKNSFKWGTLEVRYNIFNNHIEDLEFVGDFFAGTAFAQLKNEFIGRELPLSRKFFEKINWQECFAGCDNQEIMDFFKSL